MAQAAQIGQRVATGYGVGVVSKDHNDAWDRIDQRRCAARSLPAHDAGDMIDGAH